MQVFEIAFNVAYLTFIWTLVGLMTRRMKDVAPEDRRTAEWIRLAFLLLAFGDTGHVGFRVVAYALGQMDVRVNVFGTPMALLGLGSLTTAVTVTLFYIAMVYVWQFRFGHPDSGIANFLVLAGVIRLFILALPSNGWESLRSPYLISLCRNLFLVIQGLGVMALILRDSFRRGDRTFQWVGWMIAVSYAFYFPVILWAHRFPMLGMLMIPKTCAYVAIAWIAYRALWLRQAFPLTRPAGAEI